MERRTARLVGQAVFEFGMITRGDRVLVGLSGGKDSMMTAYALERLRRRSPEPFELRAFFVDPTGGAIGTEGLARFCGELGIPFEAASHPIFDIIESGGCSSPCSLCANIRRGILANAARRLGCGTLALGHHLDDAVETVLLNLTHGGRFSCFSPNMVMDRTGVRVIRPLIFVQESAIARGAAALGFETLDLGCRYGADSRRAEAKRTVSALAASVPDLRRNVLHALMTDAASWREARRK